MTSERGSKYDEAVRALAASRSGGPLPDRGLVTDAYVQEEVRRRRLAERLATLEQAAGDPSRNVEGLRQAVQDAESRAALMANLRNVLGTHGAGVHEVDKIRDALRTLQAKNMLAREDLDRLANLGLPGRDPR